MPAGCRPKKGDYMDAESLDEVWADDVLGRREDASYLHDYLTKRYDAKKNERGFVLALNAEWGYGKSFLLERWKRQAVLQKFPAIHFDAWRNDFADEPLLAFIAELQNELTQYLRLIPMTRALRRKTTTVLKKLWKPSLTILAAAGAKHLIGASLSEVRNILSPGDDNERSSSHDEDELKSIEKKLQEAARRALEGHKTTQAAIQKFKEDLTALIVHLTSTENVNLPLLVFIDELDRCRPNYAIELLEGVKHLFGVPGVYFIIATNTSQLAEAVKAVYGAGFDGQRYLKRFFDLQYSLAEPSNEKFLRACLADISAPPANVLITGLSDYPQLMGVNDGVSQPTAEQVLKYVLAKHADAFGLGLRDQQQLVIILEAAFFNLIERKIHIFFLVFLATVYQQDVSVFNEIERKRSLNAETGIGRIFKPSERGLVGVPFYNEHGQSRPKLFSVADIAEAYFSHFEHDPSRTRGYEFPDNLFRGLDTERRGNKDYALYARYFDVVRSAGGFGNKR